MKLKIQHPSLINQPFETLCTIVEQDDNVSSSDQLKMSKESIKKELFKQTEKIARAKEKLIEMPSATEKKKGFQSYTNFTYCIEY